MMSGRARALSAARARMKLHQLSGHLRNLRTVAPQTKPRASLSCPLQVTGVISLPMASLNQLKMFVLLKGTMWPGCISPLGLFLPICASALYFFLPLFLSAAGNSASRAYFNTAGDGRASLEEKLTVISFRSLSECKLILVKASIVTPKESHCQVSCLPDLSEMIVAHS